MERKQFDHHISAVEDQDWYISCDVLTVGDYGGSGSIGEANIRALEKEQKENDYSPYLEMGGHGHKQLWLYDTPENRDIIKRLEEDYPLVDEEMHSEVECEWEQEAWDDYGVFDIRRDLKEQDYPVLADHFDECLDKGELWECYREAMEGANQYPTTEYNGAYLPLGRIVHEFAAACSWRIVSKIQPLNHYGLAPNNEPDELLILADYVTDSGAPLAGELGNYLRDLSTHFTDMDLEESNTDLETANV